MGSRSTIARLTATASIATVLFTSTAGAAASAAPRGGATNPPPASRGVHGLGLIPDHRHVAPALLPRARTSAVPPSVDLTKWGVPIGDQGQVGSCVTWAIDYGMLGWYSRHDAKAGQPFAPMYTYAQIAKENGGDNGTSFERVLRGARSSGSEAQARYPQGPFDYVDQPTADQRQDAANHRISSWQTLFAGGPQGEPAAQEIKNALAHNKPVALGIPVREGFDHLSSDPSAVVDDTTTNIRGYHAVLALGYNEAGVLVQNSWGTSWGNKGYGRLSWNVIRQDTFGAYTISGLATPSVQHTGRRTLVLRPGLSLRVGFGKAGDVPLTGDWNGNGVDTIGTYANGVFRLRNGNSAGPADVVVSFGLPGDIPVVGDWDGNGTDTVGFVRGNTWYLRNSNTSGPPDITFTFGKRGDIPVVGDWNGDHIDTIGMVHGTTWELRNTNSDGAPNVKFSFGNGGDARVMGDWNGDGIDTPAVVHGSTWSFRNVNTTGPVQYKAKLGSAQDVPLAGRYVRNANRDMPSVAD